MTDTNAGNPPQTTPGSGTAEPLDLEKLRDQDRELFLQMAVNGLVSAVTGQPMKTPPEALEPDARRIVMGTFVTLKRGELLRSSSGVLGKPMPVGAAISSAAVRAATEDRRLTPISACEVPHLSLELTLLGPFKQVAAKGEERASAIKIGRHGVMVQQGKGNGLLLPSVAAQNGWRAEQFLQAACQKAGIPVDAWQTNECQVYVFDGRLLDCEVSQRIPQELPLQAPPPMTAEQLSGYAGIAGQNIVAIATGGTPSYVIPHLPDATVNALVLSMEWTATDEEQEARQGNAVQVSLRPGLPLQSTLYQMCQHAAAMFQQRRFSGELKVGVTLGTDPAHHGFGRQADLQGVDPEQRALVISDARHCGFCFDPRKTPKEAYEALREGLPVGSRDGSVHSFQVMSTLPHVLTISAPTPVDASGARPAAVAGQLYPAQDAARRAEVKRVTDELDQQSEATQWRQALAVMVPHGPLKSSGKIAAEVWRGLGELDSRPLVILSPKHTNNGVNWGVCPFERWQLSSTVGFDADRQLAQWIVDAVTAFELDAAAHQQEHGIEVQLPLLEQFAPRAKVVGLTMYNGTWEDIEQAAGELAQLLKGLEEPPLLVISSDLNHYASEAENRRRDRLALDALATGDPQHLIDVCKQHQISMCGLVPTAFVLETLRQLGQPFTFQELSYTNSGITSGDKSRVIGYAGAVFLPE